MDFLFLAFKLAQSQSEFTAVYGLNLPRLCEHWYNGRMAKKNVLIVEMMDWHDEILPHYVGLLPSLFGDDVRLRFLVSPVLFKQLQPLGFDCICLEPPWQRFVVSKSGLRKPYYKKLLSRWIKRLEPDAVVFNTVETGDMRLLPAIVEVAAHTDCYVTVHHRNHPIYDQLEHLERVKLLCLNRYNYELINRTKRVDGYYTCAFPLYPDMQKQRAQSSYWRVVVPGHIDPRRRDYQQLIALAKAVPSRLATL